MAETSAKAQRMPAGPLEITGKLSYHRPLPVHQFPPVRLRPDLEDVSCGQSCYRAMHGIIGSPIARVAQENITQAQPPVTAGQFRWRCRGPDRSIAQQH